MEVGEIWKLFQAHMEYTDQEIEVFQSDVDNKVCSRYLGFIRSGSSKLANVRLWLNPGSDSQ
jgi:hypothetical protein